MMISNKKATFEILERLKSGDQFRGYDLMNAVKAITGKSLYPATALRYLREYREAGRQIVNIHKMQSLYKIV